MPVMQLKLFHPTDDHYGFSPLEAAAFAIDVHNASGLEQGPAGQCGAALGGAGLWRQGRRAADDRAVRGAEGAGGDDHAGTMNAGRPMILEGGLDWKPMSWTPADMDFIAGKHAAAREIALAFGVSAAAAGDSRGRDLRQLSRGQCAFWRGTVVPLVRKTAAALTAGWVARFGGVRIEADLEAVPALQAERDALWARLRRRAS
jgi:phage portal protein BeeE